ncbi:hypothetical protein CWATWH0005_5821 [Crocosphaera watsonii WH 0005]|uniref:Uncharacterized protein n=1 Tax=Crocosphaera watsonii WH 0005 TaxID=423472 RepID=T2IPF4_CROWT|nr:hypothetical protein CWATWH0005_5821 [Crocosphaera watsonii WH 0005]
MTLNVSKVNLLLTGTVSKASFYISFIFRGVWGAFPPNQQHLYINNYTTTV